MKKKLVLIAAILALCGCGSLARKPDTNANFTGIWRIDREVSGNPATLFAGDDGSTGDAAAPPADALAELESQQLDIVQADGTTRITYDGGIERNYDWGARQSGTTRSGWQHDYFVVNTVMPNGRELMREFILSDAGSSLTVVTVYNKQGMTQFYKLDDAATEKAHGNGQNDPQGGQATGP